MSEQSNALVPYTESRRDQLECELAEVADKPEIHWERRHGLDIHVYYLRKLGSISMALLMGEGRARTCREFPVPNDKVNDAIAHPEDYAWKAGLSRNTTRPFQEDDGA
jgi:hypothetical protein